MSNKLQLRRSTTPASQPSAWQAINAWEPFVNMQDEKMFVSKWDWTFFQVWWELTPLPTYTITNDTPDRVIDANSITLNKLADVVATLLRDAQEWLVGQPWYFQSKARASMSTWQSIPDNTYTDVVFDSEDYDEVSEFDIGTWIFTVATTGYYSVKASVWLASLISSQNFGMRLYKNTSIIIEKEITTSSAWNKNQDINSDLYLTAWDTVKIQVLQDSWSAKTTQTNSETYMSIHRFG